MRKRKGIRVADAESLLHNVAGGEESLRKGLSTTSGELCIRRAISGKWRVWKVQTAGNLIVVLLGTVSLRGVCVCFKFKLNNCNYFYLVVF